MSTHCSPSRGLEAHAKVSGAAMACKGWGMAHAEAPTALKPTVFISFSRTDGAFAEELRVALIARGFDAYLDREAIWVAAEMRVGAA